MAVKYLLLLVGIASVVNCANILGITAIASPSHHIWNEVLAVALAKNGHNITLISFDPKGVQHENYHLLLIKDGYDIDHGFENVDDDNDYLDPDMLWEFFAVTCEKAIKSDALKTLNNYPPDYKFDLIIYDISGGECLYPLIKRFGNPPVVGMSAFGMQPYMAWYLGAHIYSYMPFYGAHYSPDMSLLEKLDNVIKMNYFIYSRRTKHLPKQMELAKTYFGQNINDFNQVEKNISIALLNNDINMDYPLAIPPNVVLVGGMQVARTKPLNKEFQKIFDESKEDIIYFSLGSNLRSEKLSGGLLEAFTKCFETLPYTILWKIDNKNMTLPKNVISKKWMPQSDILANPKTKLFISHGGGLGTQEAMYHGVPVIGVPFFADQFNNVKKLVSKKIGVFVKLRKIKSDYVCKQIKEGLKSMYYENMQLISRRVKDQITTPLERAVFSVEYVLRHGGAHHLSSAVRDMTIFESQNLDLVCLVLAVVLIPLTLIIVLIKKCCKRPVKVKRN